jgi:hypothetical protein
MTMPTWTEPSKALYVPQLGAVSVLAFGGLRHGQPDPSVVYALQLGRVFVLDNATQPAGRTVRGAWSLGCLAVALNPLDYYEAAWACDGHVYLTTDFARTITPISDTLRDVVQFQDSVKPLAVVIVNLVDGARAYVVGTERGLFVSFSFAPTVWRRVGAEAEFPNVVIFGTMRWVRFFTCLFSLLFFLFLSASFRKFKKFRIMVERFGSDYNGSSETRGFWGGPASSPCMYFPDLVSPALGSGRV